jgi:hypothetical protein
MNMVSDNFHDASVGNLIDIVVVRIIYLYKEEEEMDLLINQDSDSTLESFCDWQIKMNPADVTHPNHHDVAVLLTKNDLCANDMTDCGLLGLAYMAQACNPKKSCAICEDDGLLLAVVVIHEIGHVLGAPHDDGGVESQCEPFADEVNAYIMSPNVQSAIAGWSTCSRQAVQEFLDNDLGDCLLDEPQDHNFKFPEMPPGAMYDADFQCIHKFRNPEAVACDKGPDTNCKTLFCQYTPEQCASYGQPAADGTKCAANMWCYNRKCVPIGERPGATNGEWGEWTPWSKCSRTCGGGVSFAERDCNDPAPQNHGRYCLGERRRYRVCKTHPCDPDAASFRQQQCGQYNDTENHWTPILRIPHFISSEPHDPCILSCVNEAGVIGGMSPRAKDGTPCKPGTKDICIAGKCRTVGCDWILDSDNVDDRCGICGGDGTECTIVEGTFTENGKGYKKFTTIPAGSKRISIEELKPSMNTLALKAEDDKTFYLNGDYQSEPDRELHIAGTVGYYFHPDHELEKIVIAGPTTSKILVYACFFGEPNPGTRYSYAVNIGSRTSGLCPNTTGSSWTGRSAAADVGVGHRNPNPSAWRSETEKSTIPSAR